MQINGFGVANITDTTELLPSEDTISHERGALKLNEVVICIGILALLTLVALCLFYLCAKKYCCSEDDSTDLEANAIKNSSISSNNQDSIPTIQKAVDGTESAKKNDYTPPKVSPSRRRRKLTPGRNASSSLKLASAAKSGIIPPARKNVVLVHLKRISTAKRSRRSKNQRPGKSNISGSDQRAGKSNISGTDHKLGKSNISGTDQKLGKSNISTSSLRRSEIRDRNTPVSTQQQIQPQSQLASVTQKEQAPNQVTTLQDVPITADIISKNLKETQKEYSMFKSPNFFD